MWIGTAAVVAGLSLSVYFFLKHSYFDQNVTDRPVRSLSVLPFITVGDDPDSAHLANGITETLIQRLSRIRQIVVKRNLGSGMSPTLTDDIKIVGSKLGVDALIDGTVQRSGQRVRVTARMIRVSDGNTLWNGTFEADAAELFNLQDMLSEQAASSLSLELTGSEMAAMKKRGTSSVEAEMLYQRGRYFWKRRSHDGFLRSIEHFKQAIEIDPNYAQPYSGIADAYLLLGDYGFLSPEESTALAKIPALKALQLDPDLAEAYASLGYAQFLYDWTWSEAENSFKKAIELDPNYPTLRQWYAEFLIAMGRSLEARDHIRAAQLLDPQSPGIVAVSCWISYIEREYRQALETCSAAIEMDPQLYTAHFWTGQVLEMQGDHAEAIRSYRRALELSPESSEVTASLVHALGRQGNAAEAKKLLNMLKEKRNPSYVSAYFFSLMHLGIGEHAAAISEIETAFKERSRALPFFNVDPMLDELRNEPEFANIVRSIGLPSTGS